VVGLLNYLRPIPLSRLTIILIHPALHWIEEQIAVFLHKGNVFNDLSGWPPPDNVFLKSRIGGLMAGCRISSCMPLKNTCVMVEHLEIKSNVAVYGIFLFRTYIFFLTKEFLKLKSNKR
jgi:hypothetical protein